ncbi:hypothetical protein DYB37_004908 [Aphanomyces astaci]|uniref:Sugar phosphate transporter domain-containing protein n=1 Tax=Aphanomyces astaci TaxID=112090 RepID=A0A3R6XS71_APHAT|nr:hypothetical protein DYB35_001614 [Aphanomyces astaci]RHZ20739.1 hypothetical protein DYB37_004908 [Aphanomyces astaci]
MLLPLCNYLGMMLVGVIPSMSSSDSHHPTASILKKKNDDDSAAAALARTESLLKRDDMELTRRQAEKDINVDMKDSSDKVPLVSTSLTTASTISTSLADLKAPLKHDGSSVGSLSVMQSMLLLNVVLDFGGCIFANIGLSMAGSGVFQVLYSSGTYEWLGIAIVTFGLAFSAMGQSNGGRNAGYVLMGCVNTLIGAAFYGGNYGTHRTNDSPPSNDIVVTGEFILMLPERPEPKDLCLKMGICCVTIISVYQMFWVLPQWTHIITEPVMEAHGDPLRILGALSLYTLSQLAHGLTYFMMLGSCGAVTTGIMQSLRAVCVFGLSSVLYCSRQESQCFDAKRGIATLFVVAGVLFYSWAKGHAKIRKPIDSATHSSKKPHLPLKNCIV